MKVIVAGCGFVGEALRRRLVGGGHEALGLTLSGSDTTGACDISDFAEVESLAVRAGEVDAIVHCASSGRGGDREERYRSVYLEGCKHLLAVFPSARLIFTSSTSVYAQTDGSEVDEDSPASPTAKTGQILRAAEELAIASGGCVARLAGIYGPGRSFLLKRFLQGEASIDGRWINQIHRDDAAAALEFLLQLQPGPGSGIFNVTDDRPLSQLECYQELSRRFGRPVPPESPPDPNRSRGWTNKRVRNAKLRGLGWTPRYPNFFDALDHDPALVPSIRDQVD